MPMPESVGNRNQVRAHPEIAQPLSLPAGPGRATRSDLALQLMGPTMGKVHWAQRALGARRARGQTACL